MQFIKNASLAFVMALMTTSIYAGTGIKNAKTITVSIQGSSVVSKTLIEKAGAQKNMDAAGAEQHKDHVTADTATSKLEPLYQSYFAIQQALVQSDAKAVAQKANELSGLVKAVKMGALSSKEHDVWMEVMKKLNQQAMALKMASGIEKQRAAFASLTETLYPLIKASKSAYKVYYNHCPMYNGGANWLSKEQGIKNPYYGSKMLTCGSTKETIQ
ncbi:DUF3347 domain-containing protein [Niabella hirudinis]|uniref:DUF3347 domain-containing protein n=1 Tax=Niabella hirudinis TaxID=1285929 RepID=UPI003EBE47B6